MFIQKKETKEKTLPCGEKVNWFRKTKQKSETETDELPKTDT
jgi:hypothetical protein